MKRNCSKEYNEKKEGNKKQRKFSSGPTQRICDASSEHSTITNEPVPGSKGTLLVPEPFSFFLVFYLRHAISLIVKEQKVFSSTSYFNMHLSSSSGWPRRTYAHEPGATAATDWLGIAFSTDWLSADDLGQDVGERAQK